MLILPEGLKIVWMVQDKITEFHRIWRCLGYVFPYSNMRNNFELFLCDHRKDSEIFPFLSSSKKPGTEPNIFSFDCIKAWCRLAVPASVGGSCCCWQLQMCSGVNQLLALLCQSNTAMTKTRGPGRRRREGGRSYIDPSP